VKRIEPKSSVVKSDQNFTATINLGKSLSGGQVSLLREFSMLAHAMATMTPATKLARLHA